ncbi:DUF2142 domain-containing protein [Cellulomonas soli]|uniref:DUF2142 domain-containing protein n=1 Tax=Cellulomonas soli TaxID=931535 RepID=A0A512P869_9CELL|nr:DUF2142 domain-containing protein [Cellulomonas soli]NYI57545.1 hypothetical protein [Cellulomonas soli]GEP67322.1 hypothetical protein CSO01_00370 [Cellulomonas soli]
MPHSPTAEDSLRQARRRAFWGAFAVLWVLAATWAVASPVLSGPDENAHVVKAAAVVRGELGGRSSADNPGSGLVVVPDFYRATMTYPICFAFQPEATPDCVTPLPEGDAADDEVESTTWMVRNNPVYYAVVGLPTLLPPGESVLYLMRLVSAGMCAAVLAWGFREVAGLARRSWLLLGVTAALTPMVVYLTSTVNPSALEICAALTLWVSLLALVRDPDPARLGSRAAGIAVVAVLLANSRGTSPFYVGLIALTVAAVGPWSGVLRVLRDRRSWPWLGLTVVGTALSLGWTASAGTLEAGGADHPELGFLSTALRTLTDTGDFLVVSIGRFGWLDTSMPVLAVVVLCALIGVLPLLALALARRQDRFAVPLVLVVAIGIPVLVHAWQARSVGYIWTARYSLPLTVGVLAVAGFVARDARSSLPDEAGPRLLRTIVPWLAVGQLVGFATNLRRYTVGATGSWRDVLDGAWSPPVPILLLLAVQVLALAVGTVLVLRAGTATGTGAGTTERPATAQATAADVSP